LAFGFDNFGETLSIAALSEGTTIQVVLDYRLTLDTTGLVALSANGTGSFASLSFTFPTYTTAGTYSDSVTSTVKTVDVFQSVSSLNFSLLSTVNGSVTPQSIELIITHV
jgi:hypothetical protein